MQPARLGPKPSILEIQKIVCERFGLTLEALRSRNRKRYLAHSRQMCFTLLREHTEASYPMIGRYFNGLDHTSVLYGDRQVKLREKTCDVVRGEMNILRARIARFMAERVYPHSVMIAGLENDAANEAMLSDAEPLPVTPVAKPPPRKFYTPRPAAVLDRDAWVNLGGELEAVA